MATPRVAFMQRGASSSTTDVLTAAIEQTQRLLKSAQHKLVSARSARNAVATQKLTSIIEDLEANLISLEATAVELTAASNAPTPAPMTESVSDAAATTSTFAARTASTRSLLLPKRASSTEALGLLVPPSAAAPSATALPTSTGTASVVVDHVLAPAVDRLQREAVAIERSVQVVSAYSGEPPLLKRLLRPAATAVAAVKRSAGLRNASVGEASPARTIERDASRAASDAASRAASKQRMACLEADGASASNDGAEDYFGPDALLRSIRSGAIAALRGRYLMELMKTRQPLLCRQQLPAHAFWSLEDTDEGPGLETLLAGLDGKLGGERDAVMRQFGKLFVALS